MTDLINDDSIEQHLSKLVNLTYLNVTGTNRTPPRVLLPHPFAVCLTTTPAAR